MRHGLGRAGLLVPLFLVGCGAAAPTCPGPLPAQHLFEAYCDSGAGYCFVDHQVPF